MSANIRIRPAQFDDSKALFTLRRASILAIPPGSYSDRDLQYWAALTRSTPLQNRIEDGCVLVAEQTGQILATNSLDLERREMVALFVSPRAQNNGLGRIMVNAVERLAVQFGLLELHLCAAEPTSGFYTACGYRAIEGAQFEPDSRSGMVSLKMHRQFPQRQTLYGRKISTLHQRLGIPDDYGLQHRLKLQPECPHPVLIGEDIFAREQTLTPGAARAWFSIKESAARVGIELQVVSAFRTVDHQTAIIRKKLDAGQSMEQILAVSAAPGYSEHHSGRALDITTPGFAQLEEAFEKSPAFTWLMDSAGRYRFRLSYPLDNRHGVAYEPWHWYWTG